MTYASNSEKVKFAAVDRVGIIGVVGVVMGAIYFFQTQNNYQDAKQWEKMAAQDARMITIEKTQLETSTFLKILTTTTSDFMTEQKLSNRETAAGIRNIERILDKQDKATP